MLSASVGAVLPPARSVGGWGGLLSAGEDSLARAQPDLEPVRRQIREAIAWGGATGVAIAVAHRGRIVVEEGFGWADRESGVRVTPHTPFSMASITKPFTATTLMTLVAEGKLDLDAPANTYLPGSKLVGLDGAKGPTVRQLGAHVSGLPTMFESYERGEARLALSPDGLLRAYGNLAYPPGRCYEYSNLGFAALDAVALRLTGKDVGTLMQERVLSPLGLADSFVDGNTARLAGGAVRYDPHGHAIPFYLTSTPASGELYASAHDLARFAMFSMKSRAEGQGMVLDDRGIDELFRPVFRGPSGVATTFGWFTGKLASGVPFAMKAGGQAGVATLLYLVPSEQLACLVLTNQSNARELAVGVCDQLVQGYLPAWRQPHETSGYEPAPFVATPAFLGRWAGTLVNGGARMPVRLAIESSGSASLAIGAAAAEGISELRFEGEALTGNTTGRIDSPDTMRTGARTLALKLLPHDGRLVGRVLATAGDPNFRNVRLPYVLRLERASG